MDAPLRELPGSGRRRGRRLSEAPAEAEAAGSLARLGRGLAATVLLGVLVCVALALVADAHEVAGRLGEFDPRLLLPILGLSLLNYALRFGRWQLYLRALGIDLAWGRSLGVFLVGFLLSVTPGKAGELGKAWLVRELGGGPALRAVPAVLAERVTDLLGVLVLISVGLLTFPGGRWLAAAGLAGVAAAVVLLTWERGASALFRLLGRVPRVGTRLGGLAEIYHRLRELLSPRLLAVALAIAVLAWGAEGVGFAVALRQYDPDAGLLAAVFDYNLATAAGSLSMLPGGLLAAEGSLTGLARARGLATAEAASATLITRAATLWFAVLLGLVALPFVARRVTAWKRAHLRSPQA